MLFYTQLLKNFGSCRANRISDYFGAAALAAQKAASKTEHNNAITLTVSL